MTIRVGDYQSTIDGGPIQLTVHCENSRSDNEKTGDMVQVSATRSDVTPAQAVREGLDQSVCGNCPLRPKAAGREKGDTVCYVNTMWKTGSWKAARARAPDMAAAIKAMSKKPVRFGDYGNMSSVPREVIEKLLQAADEWTLYEHEWRKDSNQWLREYAMASVHSEAEALEAQAMGWRTFRERGPDDPLMDNEIQCPHRTHGVQCVDCLLCDGVRLCEDNRADKRKNISEIAH